MRKGILIAAAVACVLTPLAAAASDWYRVTRGQSATWYIDADSIKTNGKWTSFREYSVYDDVSDRTGVKMAWAQIDLDCSARQLRYTHFTALGADGGELSSRDMPDDGQMHPLEDGTVLTSLANFVCNREFSRGVRVQNPATDTGAK